jgi:pSer/pThr/pTyr-binding forkhead associated (FHA) protein
LDDVQRDGVLGRRERQRLGEAAERLERVGRFAEAATAFELLGELDAAVRCLERGGEVERLERVYELLGRREDRARRLDRLLADYEAAMRVGARVDAETALREAAHEAPDDATVSRLLRRLTARRPPDYRVSITVGAERLVIVGQLPARLGRVDADVTLRGASVSRQHAELVADGAGLGLRDLGSRNGTLVQGVPLTGTMRLDAETRVGLGEDVELSVEPQDGPRARVTVSRGVDRGLRFEVGQAPLPLLDLPVRVRFPEGRATLCPGPGSDLRLDGQRCVAPVTLLLGDRLEIAGQSVEVDDR